MSVVISIENVHKQYRLGTINHRLLYRDVQSWWARLRNMEDPNSKISTVGASENGESFWALQDISFQVRQGEVVGIIGHNGAGKSTLLKILSRVTAPTKGLIKMKGRIASLLEVGTGFHPELTGRENIFLNGAILGMSRLEIESKFDEIVSFAEVERFLDTPVKRYSSGMYVRLAFSVAAHLETDILIVDEVLAVGDATFQRKCLSKMGDAARSGRTVLFVSHNMSAVSMLCTRGVLLDRGKVKAEGPIDEIVSLYQSVSRSRSEQNLAERKDRQGDGLARVKSIQFKNSLGKETDFLYLGEKFEVIVSTEFLRQAIGSRVEVSLVFLDDKETRIFSLQTSCSDANFSINSEEEKYTCQVDGLPVVPGIYSYHVVIHVAGNTADKVFLAGNIEVVARDFYGTGKLPETALGMFLIQNYWSRDRK